MAKRDIDETLVLDIVENGEIKHKGDVHLWIYKHVGEREDNLLCVAAIDAAAIIVKTVMTDWKEKTFGPLSELPQ